MLSIFYAFCTKTLSAAEIVSLETATWASDVLIDGSGTGQYSKADKATATTAEEGEVTPLGLNVWNNGNTGMGEDVRHGAATPGASTAGGRGWLHSPPGKGTRATRTWRWKWSPTEARSGATEKQWRRQRHPARTVLP